MKKRDYAGDLGALGYTKFSYLKEKKSPDPKELLFDALDERDLDSRIVEGLPWLAVTYVDMDWDWLVQNASLHPCIDGKIGWVSLLHWQSISLDPKATTSGS